jgi:HTH-type transcriptional regulator/antitoxin HigA
MPGDIIRRELEARGWQQKDLAEIMGRPEQAISEIVNGKKQITPETAREMACALGTSAELWMNLEMAYRLHLAEREREEDEIQRRAQLHSKLPYSEMLRRGWIEGRETLDEQEDEVCRFLRISSIDDEPPLALAARRSARAEPEARALLAWACRVQGLAEKQSVGVYAPERLRQAVPQLLDRSVDVGSIALAPDELRNLGVRFVLVEHLPQTYLDGAVLWVNGGPVVALTLRYDRMDNFWFTLAHELAHIVLGHVGVYFDSFEGERPAGSDEVEADRLAADWLLDPLAYRAFVQVGQFGSASVGAFAREVNRHPAIVVGRLQHDKLIKFGLYRKIMAKVSPYLETESGLAGLDESPFPECGAQEPILSPRAGGKPGDAL